jgi:hypothetical protein
MKLIVTRGRRRRRAGTEMKKGLRVFFFFCYKGFKGLKERKKID